MSTARYALFLSMFSKGYFPHILLTIAFFRGKMMKYTFACFIGVLIAVSGLSQTTITWDELADVIFESQYDTEMAIEIQTAKFSDHLKTFDGQEVFITGYMIPVDPLGTRYVLSRFPNANCFFCGNAGPETIVELRLMPKFVRRYATDTYATFKGKLQLNTQNLTTFNYVLLDAEKI